MSVHRLLTKAAIYTRSSKDRADASVSVQRRELQQLATERGYVIVAEFSDVVESGKDEQRPGFQQLLAAVRNHQRGWNAVLILDTSRLSRRRHISLVFEEVEARKFGVRVIYKSLPDSDPITEMLLKSILQAMDEWHSMTSKAKGLAGMAENVRQGWRAGGRAPCGYQLEHIETGAVREGLPVLKSRLIPDVSATRVRDYLSLRAQRIQRRRAAAEAGLDQADSTLIGIEWNALTYAGHTVWNMRREHGAGGYSGGIKRRPRADWTVQHATHEALITDDEAEHILVALETSSRNASRRTSAAYLLSGLIRTPEGIAWHGDGAGFYRLGKGKRIKADALEQAVLREIQRDLQSDEFIAAMTAGVKSQYAERQIDTDLTRIEQESADLDGPDIKRLRP